MTFYGEILSKDKIRNCILQIGKSIISNATMNFLNPQGRASAYAEPCQDEPKHHQEP
jgi:hypothetical protein